MLRSLAVQLVFRLSLSTFGGRPTLFSSTVLKALGLYRPWINAPGGQSAGLVFT